MSRHTGGVCFYISDRWKIKKIDCKSIERQIWWLKIEISSDNLKYFLVGVYRSPHKQNSPEQNFVDFFEAEMEIISESENYLIAGDFNIDWLKTSYYKKKLEDIIKDNYFNQIVTEPTRITTNTSSLIDYIVTNIKNVACKTNSTLKISDHETLEIKLPLSKCVKHNKTKIMRTFKYNNYAFRNAILNGEISKMQFNLPINEFAKVLSSEINNATMSMIIEKRVLNTYDTSPWFNNYLRSMKQDKVQSHGLAIWHNNEHYWRNYRIIRNKYRSELRKCEANYVSNKITESSNQKDMWRNIKKLVLKQNISQITEIEINGKALRDEQQIAEELNLSFIKTVSEIAESIPNIKCEFNINLDQQEQFRFEIISITQLMTIMKTMNNKRDPNFVSIKMLLENFDIIGTHLHHVVAESIKNGVFPDSLKEATIIPIKKIENTVSPNEIRPVNMLPTISKILEKVAYNQLNKYFEKHNLLYEIQSGFRKNHNCESILNLVVSEWKIEVGERKCVAAVFLDLKKAFEIVNRDILLQKLEKYGVKGTELMWFKSYLSNRTQRTKCGRHVSSSKSMNTGVPQGAVLGTLLFLIYINDMEKILKKCKVCMFADDTLLYKCGKNADECVNSINEDLARIEKYLKMNKIKLNTNKTKAMIINGHSNCNICIENEIIEKVKEIKYLGIIMDNNLNFTPHFEYVCKKISKKIAFLRRIRYKVSTITATNIYNTIIKPHFEYCSTILFLGSQHMKDRLQKLQNKGMRCILRCNRMTHIRDMLNKLKWLSVGQRLVMNTLLFIFKIKTGNMPIYMQRYLINVAEVQPYNLRNANDYRLSFATTSFSQNVIFYKGLKMFNEMPQELKNENNYYVFKRKVIDYVKSNF